MAPIGKAFAVAMGNFHCSQVTGETEQNRKKP
jgi:hypothetical protein